MKALRDRFVARFKLLDADRNRYRAHAFEKQSVGSVRQMHSPGRAQALRFAQRVMKDLLLLCTHGDFHLPSVDEPPPGDVHAQDLVDLVLDSTISFATSEWERERGDFGWQQRLAYYERLHREHDARGAQRKVLFNDRFLPTGERI